MTSKERQNITAIETLIRQQQLPESFIDVVETIYQPLARQIQIAKPADRVLFVSINGAQGSGKSTLTIFLKYLLEQFHGLATAGLSIDDFYLTRKQRQDLANTVHPLLVTRGVPGTHDMPLMKKTFDNLLAGKSAELPVFDKAIDNRKTAFNPQRPVDVVLFEGWCNNSSPQSDTALLEPVNELEAREDAGAIWRRYVNEQIADYQTELFSRADIKVMLQAPAFENVYEWRQKQEDKLASNTQGDKSHVMSAPELKRFIQHYERITRHNLDVLPAQSDILLPLDENQRISSVDIRQKGN